MTKHSSDVMVGLGLRRNLLAPLKARAPSSIQFLEIAPENWIGVGGKLGKHFHFFAKEYPIFCHGLSLSLGGPAPLDEQLLKRIKTFLEEYRIPFYSEHLSYCGDRGQLYDLLPIPFTEEAVHYVSQRIRRAQEILGRPMAVENVSYYLTPPLKEMNELTFIKAVLEEADCRLLLDVNNIYVNSVNHRYDPHEFLRGLPGDRIDYIHVAGHYEEAPDLIIDTHGANVIDPVWNLLDEAYRAFGVLPTLLERDFNLPPLEELVRETDHIHAMQEKWKVKAHAKRA
jgi:uncharacterized protein